MGDLIRLLWDSIGIELPLLALGIGIMVAIIGLTATSQEHFRLVRLLEPGWHRSNWRLVRGGVSNAYFDIDQFLAKPDSRDLALRTYTDMINRLVKELRGVDRLAFIETEAGPIGALQLKEALVARLGIPAFVVRPRRRLMAGAMKGALPLRGQNVVIVSDVLTSGRGILRASQMLKRKGIDAKAAVVLVNRNDLNSRSMEAEGLRVCAAAGSEAAMEVVASGA